jgi:hypothetical protein
MLSHVASNLVESLGHAGLVAVGKVDSAAVRVAGNRAVGVPALALVSGGAAGAEALVAVHVGEALLNLLDAKLADLAGEVARVGGQAAGEKLLGAVLGLQELEHSVEKNNHHS